MFNVFSHHLGQTCTVKEFWWSRNGAFLGTPQKKGRDAHLQVTCALSQRKLYCTARIVGSVQCLSVDSGVLMCNVNTNTTTTQQTDTNTVRHTRTDRHTTHTHHHHHHTTTLSSLWRYFTNLFFFCAMKACVFKFIPQPLALLPCDASLLDVDVFEDPHANEEASTPLHPFLLALLPHLSLHCARRQFQKDGDRNTAQTRGAAHQNHHSKSHNGTLRCEILLQR